MAATSLSSLDSLYDSSDLQLWNTSYNCYWNALEELSIQKSRKSSKTNKETLLELDTWYQNELPDLISSRSEPHLKHEELCRLMQWKLTRGKFRPRLTQLVRENSPQSVEDVTRTAISRLLKLEEAIEHTCQLRGVGPATASAILCAAAPDKAPFMADEAVLSVPGLGRLDYNLKHYLLYAEKIQDKVRELNTLGKTSDCHKTKWTAHDVELSLWSFHFAQKLKPELLEGTKQTKTASSDRKRMSKTQDSDDSSDEPPKTKKVKQ